MPDEQEVRWWRTSPGVIGMGAAVILTVLLALYTSGLFRSRKLMATSYFSNAGGLKQGAEVNLDGIAIGTVKSVTLTTSPELVKTPVKVLMKLNAEYQTGLHTDSTATITSLGALGDSAIDINSREAVGPPLRDGDTLKAIANPSVLDAKSFQTTINNMNAMVGRFNTVVDQIETGKGSIGQLMSNPNLTNEARATIAKAQDVATKLNGNTNTVGKFIHDTSVTEKLARISTNVQGLNASVAKLTGGPLQANVTETQTHVNSLAADLNAGKGGLGMLMTDSPLKKDLSGATAQTNALIAGIGEGKGSAGKFVAVGPVSVDMTKLQTEASALATMIRQNPTKYLTIQVRIF